MSCLWGGAAFCYPWAVTASNWAWHREDSEESFLNEFKKYINDKNYLNVFLVLCLGGITFLLPAPCPQNKKHHRITESVSWLAAKVPLFMNRIVSPQKTGCNAHSSVPHSYFPTFQSGRTICKTLVDCVNSNPIKGTCVGPSLVANR